MNAIILAPGQETPAELALRITMRAKMLETHAQKAVEYAFEIGQLLNEAKPQINHGEWEQWLTEHCHLQAELIEIDENLCRSELTASQRSHYTKRRKQIWEALYPAQKEERQRVADLPETEVGEVCPPQFAGQLGGARPQDKGFAASTAAITGEAKRTINQHLARAEALGDDLPRVQGTSLDKGVELAALRKKLEAVLQQLTELQKEEGGAA